MHSEDGKQIPVLTARQIEIRKIIESCCETVDPNYHDEITNPELNEAAGKIEELFMEEK